MYRFFLSVAIGIIIISISSKTVCAQDVSLWTGTMRHWDIEFVTPSPDGHGVCTANVIGQKDPGVEARFMLDVHAGSTFTEAQISEFNIGDGNIPECDLYPHNPQSIHSISGGIPRQAEVVTHELLVDIHAHEEGDCAIGKTAEVTVFVTIMQRNNVDGNGIPPILEITNKQCF